MLQTLSRLFDSNHFIHPRQLDDLWKHHKPNVGERIFGIALFIFSIPFTLGIGTGLYLYFANRKVNHIVQRDQSYLDERVNAMFGESLKSDQKTKFIHALRDIQKNKDLSSEHSETLDHFSEVQFDTLLKAALEYDNLNAVRTLLLTNRGGLFWIDQLKSVKMIRVISNVLPEEKIHQLLSNVFASGKGQNIHGNDRLCKAMIDMAFKHKYDGRRLFSFIDKPQIASYLIRRFGIEALNQNGDFNPIFDVKLEILQVLVEKGFEIRTRDLNGNTILHRLKDDPLQHQSLIESIFFALNQMYPSYDVYGNEIEGVKSIKDFLDHENLQGERAIFSQDEKGDNKFWYVPESYSMGWVKNTSSHIIGFDVRFDKRN